MRVAALVLASMLSAACGEARAPVAAPTVPREGAAAAPAPAHAQIAPVGKMTLRRMPDGMLFVTKSGAWLVGDGDPITVAHVTRGETTRDAALDAALAKAKVTAIEAIEERGGRLVLSTTAGGAQAVFTWTGRALEPSALSEKAGPARLAVDPDDANANQEEIERGRIVVEPADRYPRAPTQVTKLRGQLVMDDGGLVVIGHVEGSLAAETWRAPHQPARMDLLPDLPPQFVWDPHLAPQAAILASPSPGHACVVPFAFVESQGVRYLACFDGERWRGISTGGLDGVIASLAGAEGWIWVTTFADARGVFRRRLDGDWERVGALEDAGSAEVRMRSAREVYVVDGTRSWVALEQP